MPLAMFIYLGSMSCSSSSVSPFSSITSLCGHSQLADSESLFSNAQESGDQFTRHPFAPLYSEVIALICILFVPSDNDNNSKKLPKDESKPRADQRRKGRRKFTSSLQAGHMSHSSEQSQEGGAKKFAYLTQGFTPSSPRGDHSIQQRTKRYLITSQTDKNIALLI